MLASQGRPLGGWAAAATVGGRNTTVEPAEAGPDRLRLGYRNPSGGTDPTRLDISGSLTFGPGHPATVHSHTRRLAFAVTGRTVGTEVEEYTYQPPTAGLPWHLPSRCVRSSDLTGKPISRDIVYTDDAVEVVPDERLHLAYYGLPNELVEDETGHRLPLPLAVAGGVLAVVLVVRWRLRRRR